MDEYSTSISSGDSEEPAVTGQATPSDKSETAGREDVARAMGCRAKLRRIQLGMSVLDLCEKIGGIRARDLFGWEARLPFKHITAEARWEAALDVPPGWLRDTSIDTPAVTDKPMPRRRLRGGGRVRASEIATAGGQAAPTHAPVKLPELDFDEGTVAHELVQLCMRGPSTDGMSLNNLVGVKRRMIMLLACRAGVFGPYLALPSVVAAQFDRSIAYMTNLERNLRSHLQMSGVPVATPAMDRLESVAQQYLPCPVARLNVHLREYLGGDVSVVDVIRFARHVLGRKLFKIAVIGSEETVLPASMSEDDLDAAREATVSLMKSGGATTINRVLDQLRGKRSDIDGTIVRRWCQALGGFEWLDEQGGWFWLGPSINTKAGTAVRKVLAGAGCPVHIEDLRRALQGRLVLGSAAADELPKTVLARMVVQYAGVVDGADTFSLVNSATLDSILTPTELMIHKALADSGNQAEMRTLTTSLVDTGAMTYATLASTLVQSPVFVRLGRHGYGIRGRTSDRGGRGRPVKKEQTLELGLRIKARREELGLTMSEVAARAGGITLTQLTRFEHRPPRMRTPLEARLEQVLNVPEGWVRDPGVGEPPAPTETPGIARVRGVAMRSFVAGTVAYELADIIRNAVRSGFGGGTRRYAERNIEIINLWSGLYGAPVPCAATLAEIKRGVSAQFGLSTHTLKSVISSAKDALTYEVPATPVIDRLARECHALLPLRTSEFDAMFRDQLGSDLSIVDLARTCEGLLGREVFNLSRVGGSMMVLAPGSSVDVLPALRKVVFATIWATGAAQLSWVCGALSRAVGRAVEPKQAARWCALLEGFEWLNEEYGWFRLQLRPEPQSSAKRTILKVLSIAPGPVEMSDLMGAVWRLRTHFPEIDRQRGAFVEMPADVFALLLAGIPEIEQVPGEDRYRLRQPIPPEELLNPSELSAYRILRKHGGVIANAVLGRELRAQKNSAWNEVILRCSLVTSVERGIYRLYGYPLDPGAYARACEARLQDASSGLENDGGRAPGVQLRSTPLQRAA